MPPRHKLPDFDRIGPEQLQQQGAVAVVFLLRGRPALGALHVLASSHMLSSLLPAFLRIALSVELAGSEIAAKNAPRQRSGCANAASVVRIAAFADCTFRSILFRRHRARGLLRRCFAEAFATARRFTGNAGVLYHTANGRSSGNRNELSTSL